MPPRIARTLALVALAAVATSLASCSAPPSPFAEGSGKVTSGGKPVVLHKLTFVAGDRVVTTVLKSDGSWACVELPLGKVIAYFTEFPYDAPGDGPDDAGSDPSRPPGAGAKPKAAPGVAKLPAKFYDAKTAELSFEIKPGKNVIDIPLP